MRYRKIVEKDVGSAYIIKPIVHHSPSKIYNQYQSSNFPAFYCCRLNKCVSLMNAV
jgi:hypothetical protein